MLELFGARRRTIEWRRIWLEIARAQADLGLPIDRSALDRLEARIDEIDFGAIEVYEKTFRHDVMAHLHAFGDLEPAAKGSLHLGATSMDVSDNADLVIFREALGLVRRRLAGVLSGLADFARRWRDRPVLGRTHLQPAQPTTLGKRASLWAYDLVLDLREVEAVAASLRFRGIQGTTGTQDSFLALFDGDAAKVAELDRRVRTAFSFEASYSVTGQTYPRKVDSRILAALSGVGQSASKFAGDLRILAMLGEVCEPIEAGQVGSSAMAYKKNPVRCERMNALARHLIALEADGAWTAAEQRLERTLDDSANRRISLPEAFLATDAILRLYGNVVRGLVVDERAIDEALDRHLPFLATERILMAASRAGGDRQALHERIRVHSRQVAEPAELLPRLSADAAFAAVAGRIPTFADARALVGLAPAQVDRFLAEEVEPALAGFDPADLADWELKV